MQYSQSSRSHAPVAARLPRAPTVHNFFEIDQEKARRAQIKQMQAKKKERNIRKKRRKKAKTRTRDSDREEEEKGKRKGKDRGRDEIEAVRYWLRALIKTEEDPTALAVTSEAILSTLNELLSGVISTMKNAAALEGRPPPNQEEAKLFLYQGCIKEILESLAPTAPKRASALIHLLSSHYKKVCISLPEKFQELKIELKSSRSACDKLRHENKRRQGEIDLMRVRLEAKENEHKGLLRLLGVKEKHLLCEGEALNSAQEALKRLTVEHRSLEQELRHAELVSPERGFFLLLSSLPLSSSSCYPPCRLLCLQGLRFRRPSSSSPPLTNTYESSLARHKHDLEIISCIRARSYTNASMLAHTKT